MSFDWIDKLKAYDINDFLSRVSIMSIIPSNQNKDFTFNYIIDKILQNKDKEFTGINLMSNDKFKQIINYIYSSQYYMLDPIEYPFVQRIQFYGNRWVFNGCNKNAAYRLQMIINSIILFKNDFKSDFVNTVSKMLEILLDISNKIATVLQYGMHTLKHCENTDIVFPDSKSLNRLINAVTFNIDDYNGIIDEESFKELFASFNCLSDGTDENYYFYQHPFLKISSEQFICLNPSMIPTFAISFILKLSEKHGILQDIFAAYNSAVWKDCCRSIRILGHKKIKEKDFDISLIDQSDYKEIVLSGCNDRILVMLLLSDNGIDYNTSVLNDVTYYNSNMLNERIEYMTNKLSTRLSKDNIYFVIITSFLERGLNLGLDSVPEKLVSMTSSQLQCVAINERNNNNFLLHYIEFKKDLSFMPSPYTNDYHVISLYTSNGYSFYFSDDINALSANLFIDFGEALDYTLKALTKDDRQLIEYPNSNYYKEIILNDSYRNIYCPTNIQNIELVVMLSNVDFWISSEKANSSLELDIYHSIVDMISYWVGELKSVIESFTFSSGQIMISNKITGDVNLFYDTRMKSDLLLSDWLRITYTSNNTLCIEWTPEAYFNLCMRLVGGEKELIQIIIESLIKSNSCDVSKYSISPFFDNPLKHRMVSLDYITHPYLKPTISRFHKIPEEILDSINDEIGQYFLYKGMAVGIINSTERIKVCNEIVDFLYNKLKVLLCKYKIDNLILLVYNDLETVLYKIMYFQMNYASMVACYPEKKGQYDDDFNDLNKSSMALKFLIEYIGSVQPNGSVPIGELEYEYLQALCMQIIEWAHTSDLFCYNIINEKIQLLKSGRIGFKKDRVNYLSKQSSLANNKRLNIISDPGRDVFNHRNDINGFQKELDDAFEDEYGYSFSAYSSCIGCLIGIGDAIDSEVKEYNRNELISIIAKECNFTEHLVVEIIDSISLLKRNDFLEVTSPFRESDVYPWRYNRRLSFVRRPIIYYNDNLIWGNRQLYHSLRYTMDLITNGKFEASSKKMKVLVSKIANSVGNSFNEAVASKLHNAGFEKVYTKVKKINKKRIEDENNNTLGDIDVLLINESRKKIIVIETKDFSFSRTPYEINREYLNVFRDSDKKLSYVSKHQKRVKWAKKHLDDIIIHYNLPNYHWKIDEVLIVSEPIVSNHYYHKKQKIIVFSDIDFKTINRL